MKDKVVTNYLLDKESFFWTPDHLDISAWIEHIPFAFWIIEVLKPKIVVELGVHNGISYFSFCQAVKRLNIGTACYGVDTWTGDDHSGFYEEEVFDKVTDRNRQEYSRFSTLIRSTFDEARDYFIDGSIDLLHIDGLHTYEAVKHDFEAWLPKLSSHAIVVFHDINVRDRNFAVFKLWEELKQHYKHFQFDFGHGLGILATGEVAQEELCGLFNENPMDEYYFFLRNIFSDRGSSFKTKFDISLLLKQERENLDMQRKAFSQVTDSHRLLESDYNKLQESNKELAVINEQLKESHQTLTSQNAQLGESNKELGVENEQLKKQELNNSQLGESCKKLVESNEKLKEKYQISITELSEKLDLANSFFSKISKEVSDQKNTIEELNTLIQKQSQIIRWYKDTYEDRSIAGVLKEKFTSRVKKKINPEKENILSSNDIAVNNITGPEQAILLNNSLNGKYNKNGCDVKPVKDITVLPDSNEYTSVGADPFFIELNNEAALPASDEKISLKIKYQADSQIFTDVCLFSSYSFSGKVEEYVYYYLSELQKTGLSIIFISTSQLKESCVSRLSKFAVLIIERENKCPDFGSWKAGLSLLSWGKKLNSILLANDSVFGPLCDISSIISSMKNRYDVWGMTDSYEVEYHLQSYFLYFNKAAITSEVFTKFWKNVDLCASKEEVIFKYEIGLSSLFSRSNLNLGAYASIDTLSKSAVHGHKIINPTLVFWKSLIKTHKFPFLKRELIIKTNISKTYFNVDLYIHVGNWKRLIEENSAYPLGHIAEFINNYYKTVKISNSDIVLRKRKILFLSNNAEIGGPQRVLVNFLYWLKKETDIDVEIIICNEGNNELASEFAKLGIVTNFYALSESGKRNFKERLIDEVALIFSNTIENLNTQKFLSFLDVPQIIFVHEGFSTLKNILSVDNNIEWVNKNVSQFIASSHAVRQNIVDYFGIDDRRVELVHKFINPHAVEKYEQERQKIKFDLGISPDAFVVGMCGKLEWKKSADLLPVIGANVCRNDNNIYILWLGASINSPLYESILFDLARAGLTERVHLLEKKTDALPFFAMFDVFVMCSREDTFPLVNLETGLAGKPLIFFRDPDGSSEYASLGIGHSVPYLDMTALTEKILGYYNNRSQLQIDKELIHEKVKNNFTTAVQAPKILQIINKYFDYEELTFVEDPLITFMTHIYYENSWPEIRNKLKNFDNGKNYFLFSISEACLIKEQIIEDIREFFKNAFFLITSNIGKDIGGKMALIDLYLLLDVKSSYIVFLQDRQTSHLITGESRENSLFKIIDPNNFKLILTLFKDPKTAIVGAKDHIINEYDNATGAFRNHNQLSKKVLMQFGMSIENYDFLGDSNYWLRSSLIENFFTKNHPILMRENLEVDNVLDLHEEKLAHRWDRIFSWVATNEGFKIKGI